MKFTRITVDPSQMGGVPCIRGLRIPVATVVGMLADGIAEMEALSFSTRAEFAFEIYLRQAPTLHVELSYFR